MNIKQLFCKHTFIVKEAKFDYGNSIPAIASFGLTEYTYFDSYSTDRYSVPHTIIHTHYKVKNRYVYLYAKQCIYCGKVVACDAFGAQEKERENDILRSEGF